MNGRVLLGPCSWLLVHEHHHTGEDTQKIKFLQRSTTILCAESMIRLRDNISKKNRNNRLTPMELPLALKSTRILFSNTPENESEPELHASDRVSPIQTA